MGNKNPGSFADILAEMNVSPPRDEPVAADPPPIPQDSLQLSVQASRAMPARKKKEDTGVEGDRLEQRRMDRQGNRLRISGPALAMSRDAQGRVAWETPRERPDFGRDRNGDE